MVHKRLYTFVIAAVFALLAILVPQQVNAQESPYIRIIAPNGGETFAVGETVRLTWETNTSVSCSFYYFTPESWPSTAYWLGNVDNANVGYFDFVASVPSGSVGTIQEKIQAACWGVPIEYSDDYFTVNAPVSPVCDKKAEVAFTNNMYQSVYRGGSITNEVAVTNPNDLGCGTALYGLSRSYPSGWTIDLPYSVAVAPGTTEYVPLTLTSSSDAAYQGYDYSVSVSDGNGGVMPTASAYVSVTPRCDATPLVSLGTSAQEAFAGTIINNTLSVTNPNPTECGLKKYVTSRSYPGGWDLNIQPNFSINGGETVDVPFTMTVAQSAPVGTYDYQFWVYSAYVDGSGQVQVNGTVSVLDSTAPLVSITSPINNDTVPRNRTVSIYANASDNVGVTKVEFYVNGVLQCTDDAAAYNCSFTTPNKKGIPYTLTAKAYDAAGNVGASSVAVRTI